MAGLMLQGTGSDVGKSSWSRACAARSTNRGLSVRPFKPQNMSNNAAVTADGGEIGRAQALQALAARVEPHTDMNPVLLKPQSRPHVAAHRPRPGARNAGLGQFSRGAAQPAARR